jgi:uncharacterized membrane protein YphA (DoxX/SURF4 family)
VVRDNFFHTFLQLLSGQTGDQINLGPIGAILTAAFYWLVLMGALAVAVANWRVDAEQRSARHLGNAAMRVVMSAMWYLGTLWKLPLPVSGGFKYWLEQTVKFSSFQWHADIMQVMLNFIAITNPLVYLLEIGMTVALALGLVTRLAGWVGALFLFNLLIGLYSSPSEWPWTYVGIMFAHLLFVQVRIGRSLGLDNLIAKERIRLPGGPGGRLARVVRAVG